MNKTKLWGRVGRQNGSGEGEIPPRPKLNPALCDRCQFWDDVKNLKPPIIPSPVTLLELLQNAHCLICRAVVTVVDIRRREFEPLQTCPASQIAVHNHGPYFLDTGYMAEDMHRFDESDPDTIVARLIISLRISILQSDAASPSSPKEDTHFIEMTPQFCLRYTRKLDSTVLASVEPWEVPFFNISLLRKWIKSCQVSHGSMCDGNKHRRNDDVLLDFRVIDVLSMRLVKLSRLAGFAALSYMWEVGNENSHVQLQRSNLRALEASGGIKDIALPNIISDAVSLCRDLGEKYLWVDRLCIIQDDADSKHSQIRNMDKIYYSATFTIIIALNERNGRGIPGSNGRPRSSSIWRPPRDCEVELRGIRPNGMQDVNSSLWNNRGWTFQERVLSRRCLFITEFHVIFECSYGQAHEELAYYSQHLSIPYFSRLFRSILNKNKWRTKRDSREFPGYTRESPYGEIDYNLRTKTDFSTYCNWIQDYTSRQLSFGFDILNAFAGVSNSLGTILSSPMIFGLPEKYMAQALLWSCLGSSGQREDTLQIPYWSWASSSKKVDFSWICGSAFKGDMEEVASLVYFYFQDPDLGFRKLHVEERWIDHVVAIKELAGNKLLPPLRKSKYKPAEWRSNRTWQECPQNPWQCLAHLTLDPSACDMAATITGSLVFNTTVASLELRRDTRDIYSRENYIERDVLIHNQQGVWIGLINKMSPEWIDAYVDKVYDFIVVCGSLMDQRSRKTMAQYFRDYDMWRLHVMLIERSPSNSHFARRVDVGFVKAHLWKDCNPRWETIVLC